MNSLPSLIINTRNNNKRASLAIPAQSNSLINSVSIINDYFVKFYTSNQRSMFDEQIKCINQKKDDHQYRHSLVITNTSSNFRFSILNNNHYQQMKRYQRRKYISNLPSSSSSNQRMMIGVDHNLMQSSSSSSDQKTIASSSPVNQHFQSPMITDSNSSNSHQKKFISSSQIRLALRCSCSLDDKQEQLFDKIFSYNEQTPNISQCILDECLLRLTKNESNTLIILSGYYRDVHQIQTNVLSSTLARLYNLAQEKDLILRIIIQDLSTNKILSTENNIVYSPTDTFDYLNNHCLNHRFNPLLITYQLQTRSLNTTYPLLNILLTNDNDTHRTKEQFSNVLMSLALSYSSNRQKQKKHYQTNEQTLLSLLNEYLLNNCEQTSKYFVYIFANIKNLKQVKYWIKIQRLFRIKRNRLKMSREQEIWIDGPLSSSKKEIWIDGPKKTSSILSPRPPKDSDEYSTKNFDTESVISSHCHVPVLPVFKDHTLLPFRSNQTLPKLKPLSNIDLKISTNKLNDDMELLEKTLENLLVPSNNNNNQQCQSLNKFDKLSLTMTNDEKNKRLSRIISPTRFEKNHKIKSENFNWTHSTPSGSSVPNSPVIRSKTHHSRISATPQRTLVSTIKKSRPTIFQRLFGLRSSSSSSNSQSHHQQIPIIIESSPPLNSPLTVTLDSHDDLMPLTTSSTTSSSASGRASSSGYESMSNTILEEMIASIPTMINNENTLIKLRNKTTRKDERSSSANSPILRDKSHRQQRLTQLKHRENELKLELARTKTFLLMDKNKIFEQNDAHLSTLNHPKPIYINEEEQLENEIEHLEQRLTFAKTQLTYLTSQKTKPSKS